MRTSAARGRRTRSTATSGLYYAAGLSPVRYDAFTAAIAIGALVRTTPYALMGNGLASGSAVSLALAGASVVIGSAGALVLLRRP